MFLYF